MKFYDFLSTHFWNQNPSISCKNLCKLRQDTLLSFIKLVSGSLIFAILFCLNIYVFALCSDVFTPIKPAINASNVACVLLLSILGLISILVWILVPKRLGFFFGFFSALLLFYWIGLSFRFSPFPYFAPLVSIGVALVYGALIYLALFFQHKIYRILTLIAIGFVSPFGFDWFIPQIFFSYSLFGVQLWQFFIIECGVLLILCTKRWLKLLGLLCLICSIDFKAFSLKEPHSLLSLIHITQTAFPQDIKWQSSSLNSILIKVFSEIDLAITQSRQIIILPETILPFVLNQDSAFQRKIYEQLLERSSHIAIIIGALSIQNNQTFNSTFVLYQGQSLILNKVVLAPFGERIPLPDVLAKPLYRIFFGVDEGIWSAKQPQDFMLFDVVFRNAICYEGTSRIIHQNAPQFIVMISNNAWFYPSIEPYFQRILLKYYARIYHTTILHSANFSESSIISSGLLSDIRPN